VCVCECTTDPKIISLRGVQLYNRMGLVIGGYRVPSPPVLGFLFI